MVVAPRPAPRASRDLRETLMVIFFLHCFYVAFARANPAPGPEPQASICCARFGKLTRGPGENRPQWKNDRGTTNARRIYFPARFASMTSQILAATSGPSSRWIARMPVGEV